MDTDFADRARYTPSGRVDPLAFVPSALLLVAVGLLIAAALEGVTQLGGLPLGITCLLPGFLLGFTSAFTVRRGHCRSRTVGVAVGAAAALLTLGAYYHLDQCLRWGV